jgi:hypothetical protein
MAAKILSSIAPALWRMLSAELVETFQRYFNGRAWARGIHANTFFVMHSVGTRELIAQVEQTTGFKVVSHHDESG